jgi:hypothetical protein
MSGRIPYARLTWVAVGTSVEAIVLVGGCWVTPDPTPLPRPVQDVGTPDILDGRTQAPELLELRSVKTD